MKELITIEHGTVNARELHLRLDNKQDFVTWIKNKVLDNPFFAENQDYVSLDNFIMQTGSENHNPKNYALTMDTAKKLAMAEQTPTGDKMVNYFLNCEYISKLTALPQCHEYSAKVTKKRIAVLIDLLKAEKKFLKLWEKLPLDCLPAPQLTENPNWVSITECLKQSPKKPTEISEQTKINYSTVKTCLARMKKKYIVTPIGNGYWNVN